MWRTEALKLRDLVEAARGDTSLILYHFPDTGERLRTLLEEARVDYETLEGPGTDRLARLSGVFVLDSEDIPHEIKRGLGQRPKHAVEEPTRVLLAEHYPIPSRDEHVLNLHRILAPGSKFSCYVGLDEPWLAKVIGDSRVLDLLDRMGFDEGTPIEHAMVGNALRRAQEQIDGKRRNVEQTARSSAEWLRLNMNE